MKKENSFQIDEKEDLKLFKFLSNKKKFLNNCFSSINKNILSSYIRGLIIS